MNEKGVILEACDGYRVCITDDQVKELGTIQLLLEDLSGDAIIPLPNVDKETLKALLGLPSNYNYIKLFKAANYLDFKELIYRLLPTLALYELTEEDAHELREYVMAAPYFLAHPSDPSMENFMYGLKYRAQWAIGYASANGYYGVVKILLEYPDRFDPSAEDNLSIRKAAFYGHARVVELLLKDNRVDPSDLSNWACSMATLNGHTDVVEVLMNDDRIDISDAICTAAAYGHLDLLEKMLRRFPDVNLGMYNNWAFRRAAERGHEEIVKHLLSHSSVNPTALDNQAIQEAASLGHVGIVKLLLDDERVCPYANNNRALEYAAWHGHVEVVKLLMAKEGVDASNNDALVYATRKENHEIVKLLTTKKAKKNNE